MRRDLLLAMGLTLVATTAAGAATFSRTPIAPDLGIDALTRDVARTQLGRDVFGDPWATVTISHVDVYDRFPYVEARHFEVVSDPKWNRLVVGEAGQTLRAWNGAGGSVGALAQPHGLAVDDQDRVYVADTGNDRVVILQATTEFGEVTLQPVGQVTGLHAPYGVAWSDGGTPLSPADDRLYVADTGANRIVAYALQGGAPRELAAIGRLGSAAGAFAGPMAIAAGRHDGAHTNDVYVADAHNQRLAHLRFDGGAFAWVGDAPAGADMVTSLDTDRWGNLYAAAPRGGVVRKLSPALAPVAELRQGLAQPRGFTIPFFTVRDHRDGSVTRVGQASALSVEQWATGSGIKRWDLGVAVDGLGVSAGNTPEARFTLTDAADVVLVVSDAASGRVLARRSLGTLAAGPQATALQGAERTAGSLRLQLTATSRYGNGATDVASTTYDASASGAVRLPAAAALLGNWPNPVTSATHITFALPAGESHVALGVFDASGRRVRTLAGPFAPGMNDVSWDGTDDAGRAVRSGLYFTQLQVGAEHFTRRMAVVR